jgi:hypothetical protein
VDEMADKTNNLANAKAAADRAASAAIARAKIAAKQIADINGLILA